MEPDMLKVSVELPARKKHDIKAAAGIMRQLGAKAAYIVPSHKDSAVSSLEAAKKLLGAEVMPTITCRGLGSKNAAEKVAAGFAKAEIKSVLAVSGDGREEPDISVMELIRALKASGLKVAAAMVFTRKNEALRIRKKMKAGASVFYTQPVFQSNAANLTRLLSGIDEKITVFAGVLVPFPAALCRRIARQKPDFMPDTSFIKQLASAEKNGTAYEETVRMARQNLHAALKIAGKTRNVAGLHFYGISDRKFNGEKVKASRLLEDVLRKPA